MQALKNILIVEEDKRLSLRLKRMIDHIGYSASIVQDGKHAMRIINQDNIGVVLMDFSLSDMNSLELMRRIQGLDPEIAVIMLSSENATIHDVAEAAELGAYEWIQKPVERARVVRTIRTALQELTSQKSTTSHISDIETRYNIVGASHEIRRICRTIDKVASQNTTILITGESGTGKEMVAYAIHRNSRRNDKPFICVNCAAVHDSLIESELFGHKKGSFTGAHATKKGKFQLAHEGTLFLDEIGDLSAGAQAKLLRTIETGEVESLGTQKLEQVDVRIISATNKDINSLVRKGVFREDLLHRINVIEVNIPPLRQRPDDILPLANHFLNIFSDQNEVDRKVLSPSAEAVLLVHHWPGNVRELRNLIERITVLIEAREVTSQHIAQFLRFPASVNGVLRAKSFKQARKSFEKSYILHTLWENDWNISKTAEILNLPRSSLYDKLKEFNIRRSPKNRTMRLA
jgi:two-component system nitrogen regulation response regulator NtrX